VQTKGQPCHLLLVDAERRLGERVRPLFELGEISPCPEEADYESAAALARLHRPEVILVDLAGGVEAFGAIEAIMADEPTPILCAREAGASSADDFQALALGALEIFEWPRAAWPKFWIDLSRQLQLLSQVRVVKHIRGMRRKRQHVRDAGHESPFPLVAIAASLGGPKALLQLLRMIPRGFGAPICICQHISPGFTEGLAQWLTNQTALEVEEARDGEELKAGIVFVAPSGAHLRVMDDWRIHLDDGPPLAGFKPSCDALLHSAALAFGRRCIGVVLTGMGRDGANGLREVRARGGRTLVQDEATCVVYGMPAAAVELGAAEEILPLDQIAPALVRLVESC
jgi:two-component system chemotaxis response regulator CheB